MRLNIILIILILIFIPTNSNSFKFEPKEVKWVFEKEFKINIKTKIFSDEDSVSEVKIFAERLKKIVDYNNRIINLDTFLLKEKENLKNNIIICNFNSSIIKEILLKNNIKLFKREGYAIIINENYFLITYSNKKYFRYALDTVTEILEMSQLKIAENNIYVSIPSVIIIDYPKFNIRALHIAFFDINDINKIKLVIDFAAEYRYNHIFFVVNNGITYDSHPEISKKNAFSKAQVKELIKYAEEKGLKVIPEINLLSHQEWLLSPAYPELIIKEGILKHSPKMFHTYNPKDERVYKIVFNILDEIIELFKPEYIHIGHDESFGLRVFNEPESYQLFAEHINKINDYLSKKEIKTIIWSDMLRKDHNGLEKEIYKATDLISKNVIICVWYYKNNNFDPIIYFTSKGFKVIASNFKDEMTLEKLTEYLESKKTDNIIGMMATTWYYFTWDKINMLYRLISVSGKNFW